MPVLAGRTALQAYTGFMTAFRDEFRGLLGSVVTDADIGLGPRGELRYPSTPSDSRWAFPGIGEFQVSGMPWSHWTCGISVGRGWSRVGLAGVGCVCIN